MADPFQVLVDELRNTLLDQHNSFREVVSGLDADALNWKPVAEANSICVLVSHALDAEKYLLTSAIDVQFDRDRESHFRATTDSAAELLELIERAEAANFGYLADLRAEHLAREVARPGRTHTGAWWVLHAVEHTREHVGQALLTRQLWEAR
jgi:hypothetical protein